MMKVAEATNSLAPEQYGSRRQHKAIDLAVNEALTFDISAKSWSAKEYYKLLIYHITGCHS
jgi:hypothetical protein